MKEFRDSFSDLFGLLIGGRRESRNRSESLHSLGGRDELFLFVPSSWLSRVPAREVCGIVVVLSLFSLVKK